MNVQVLTLGPIQANCYILACGETALVIDPGEEPDRIAAELERLGCRPEAYLLTHGHIDHVGATGRLKQRLGGEVLLHHDDLALYNAVPAQGEAFGLDIPEMVAVDRFVQDGETLTWGTASGRILHTPGHSPGGVCLQVAGIEDADWIFTGDLLFAGSIGRTDLWGGSYEALVHSIREKLMGLPDNTIIASGHGPLTTIGRERRANPFVHDML